MATHDFEPTHFHITIGSHEPVLRVASGDTIRTWCVDAAGNDRTGASITRGGNPQTGPFFIEDAKPGEVRRRISDLRHDFLHIRRTLTPTRDAVHKIVDGRVDLEGADLFPDDVQLHFADAYDKLLRATESLDLSRDLVAGVRDYAQAKIANDQNEVMKRLTAIASILLVPTFIVGLYGQNFRQIPELHWGFGYWWSWGWIVLATVAQVIYFRRRGWI